MPCANAVPAGDSAAIIDETAIAKQIESITQLKSQLDTLNKQVQQAQQLYASLNKITKMADIAGVLNDPSIRKALPQ
ncbi:type IV secretion system protein, partial [Rhizobium ruizarguesonis]